MEYLPIFLNLRGRTVLVDGGGVIAARRAERALGAGAKVLAFDPAPGSDLTALEGREGFVLHRRLPLAEDLSECTVVWGGSNDEARDHTLRQLASTAGVLCNIVDGPEDSDFITPSIVDRSPIIIALTTGGNAPVLSRILRARIEATLPASYGKLAQFAGGFRDRIAGMIPDAQARRHFWERMIDGPAGDYFLAGSENRARQQIDTDLAAASTGEPSAAGEVYLVGAGPGDPDLLTFRALRLMQRADVVLYDRLLGDDILSLVRRDAERIDVGKKANNHTMAQQDISKLLVTLAQQGKRVLRLKGGDPYIFGRGGEEIEELAAANIPFQVVPGITAASGCSTYAGIPLTHREHAQSCTFITAHGKDGVLDLDWDVLIRDNQTIAVYMGLGSLPLLTSGFIERGVPTGTPVAVIENGTRPNQRTVTGTLDSISDVVADAGFKGPAIIVIGGVVSLRDKLSWKQLDRTAHALSVSAETSEDLTRPIQD
jgi:uroporphyrin-III C-methyltransferase/precorrin-2 dehydrogenase/sirohydrochlorin ferrochelatase